MKAFLKYLPKIITVIPAVLDLFKIVVSKVNGIKDEIKKEEKPKADK